MTTAIALAKQHSTVISWIVGASVYLGGFLAGEALARSLCDLAGFPG
jgi:hypothetical protein